MTEPTGYYEDNTTLAQYLEFHFGESARENVIHHHHLGHHERELIDESEKFKRRSSSSTGMPPQGSLTKRQRLLAKRHESNLKEREGEVKKGKSSHHHTSHAHPSHRGGRGADKAARAQVDVPG